MNIGKDLKIPLNGGLDGCLVFNKDQFYIATIQTIDGEGEKITIQATVNRVSDKGVVHDLGGVTCKGLGTVVYDNYYEWTANQDARKKLNSIVESLAGRIENTEGEIKADLIKELEIHTATLSATPEIELTSHLINSYAEVIEYVKVGKLSVAGNQWLKGQVLSSGLKINDLLQ